MKRYLMIAAVIALFVPVPAYAGWTSGSGPIGRTMDCVNPLGLDNCILNPHPFTYKKSHQSHSIDRQVYKSAVTDYKKSAPRKPGRALQDPRVK